MIVEVERKYTEGENINKDIKTRDKKEADTEKEVNRVER